MAFVFVTRASDQMRDGSSDVTRHRGMNFQETTMIANRTVITACACLLGLTLVGCGSGGSDRPSGEPAQVIQINGAGATFPFPIYSKWFDEYHKLHPNVQINYQSVGSGAGIRQLVNQ